MKLVEQYLASPHYGERWARHWLDVVRFAETSGFETNVPRPNAWPYRDYVIQALNEDKPYPQFVLEQRQAMRWARTRRPAVVGGAWDRVKSPDINLTLTQRNDELHDMVSTTAASAFLALTVGCARCHNHKFDPISQTDYYAMQAIFAGVQHGGRPVKTPGDSTRETETKQIETLLAGLEDKLERFEPLARPTGLSLVKTGTTGGQTNAVSPTRRAVRANRNVERFAPVEAKYVRFTILATSGAEPCIDELEIFSAGENSRNVALASGGAKATASGTYAGSDFHKLEHINDGNYGNSRSWISSEAGKGWVQIELPQKTTIDRIVWARDREEKYSDRLATTYVIEAATEPGHWHAIASSEDRRPYQADAGGGLDYPTNGLAPGQVSELNSLVQQAKEDREKLKKLNERPMVYGGVFGPGPSYRLNRGDPMQPREQVTPAALAEFGAKTTLSTNSPERERRLALAKWIIDPQNPMTARSW